MAYIPQDQAIALYGEAAFNFPQDESGNRLVPDGGVAPTGGPAAAPGQGGDQWFHGATATIATCPDQ